MPTVSMNAITLASSVLDLQVLATPVCQLNPFGGIPVGNDLPFGDVNVGTYSDEVIYISNVGYGNLTGTPSIDSVYSQFEIVAGGSAYDLEHNEIRQVTVRYTPDSYDIHAGVLETGNDTYCDDANLSGTGTLGEATPYLKHTSAPVTTVYFRHAAILPHTVSEDVPATISRTEDKALKVYSQGLGGDRKRIWLLTAYMKQLDTDGYQFVNLENLWREVAQGALKQLEFRDNFNVIHTVRIVKFGPPQWQEAGARDLIKIRLVLEEDY